VKWEILVSAAKPSNEVVFKSVNDTFGGILPMHVWLDQLVINVFHGEEILKGSGGFIVQLVETRSRPAQHRQAWSTLKAAKMVLAMQSLKGSARMVLLS